MKRFFPDRGGAKRKLLQARRRGAALLMAMLTVALVATFAASAFWQQWRAVEVESAERTRMQAGWLLWGALDWARAVLRDDAQAGGPDHLGELWAAPPREVRLSGFLVAEKDRRAANAREGPENTALSMQIEDLQSRLNVTNLLEANQLSRKDLHAFGKLFEMLGVSQTELVQLAENLRVASDPEFARDSPVRAPLLPRRFEQLAWLGLSAPSMALLRPYLSVLPVRTPVNLNTASAEVLHATVPDLSMAQARQVVAERARRPFRTLEEASRLMGIQPNSGLDETAHSVASRFFEVRILLRTDASSVEEYSVLQRDGVEVRPLWRERAFPQASLTPAPAKRTP